MDIVLLLGLLAVLSSTGWLLWHILRQQGRLLLRLEATEAHLTSQERALLGGQMARSVTGPVEATVSHNHDTAVSPVPRLSTGLEIGELAPDFSLPDLSGNLIRIADFRGTLTLVLFWRPGCSRCQHLLPHVLAWETQPPEGTPELLVVSTGSVQDNQALGLHSSVVLEQADGNIRRMFGIQNTPAAVLIDAEGRIASKLAVGGPAILALTRALLTPGEEKIELTIGMATYNDYDGVYFTLQALRLYQDLEHTELLVIDNYGCETTQKLVEGIPGARYVRATDAVGTAAPRDRIFREARGSAVLCCDCHVLFAPGVIAQLKQYYREHPECQDLLQGPLLHDGGQLLSTHFDPVWRNQMWGTWGCDPRGWDPRGEPFDIPMQGLGVFSCRKQAWLGFHPQFRGFGGEEGYIHEKFRQAGRRCLCLPWLRWMHRFGRPAGVKYQVTVEDKLHNYIIGHAELGLDLAPVLQHFSRYLPPA